MKQSPDLKTLQLESAKNTIINNLKVLHQSKLVNIGCLLRGLDMNTITTTALNELIMAGRVKTKEYYVPGKFNTMHTVKLYCFNNLG